VTAGPSSTCRRRSFGLRPGPCRASVDELFDVIDVKGFIAVDVHGSEFEKGEGLPVQTDSGLPEDDRPFRGRFDRRGYRDKEW
jgi:hypothetical protein